MTQTAAKGLTPLARMVGALLVVFLVVGLIWYGFDTETRERIWQNLVARPSEKMAFRFVLQPVMSAIAAFRDGVNDAKSCRAPYFWTLLSNPAKRLERLEEGLVSTAQILMLGLAMDILYQFLVLGTFYPGEAAIVAVVLAFLPYLILRGPMHRLARIWVGKAAK